VGRTPCWLSPNRADHQGSPGILGLPRTYPAALAPLQMGLIATQAQQAERRVTLPAQYEGGIVLGKFGLASLKRGQGKSGSLQVLPSNRIVQYKPEIYQL